MSGQDPDVLRRQVQHQMQDLGRPLNHVEQRHVGYQTATTINNEIDRINRENEERRRREQQGY